MFPAASVADQVMVVTPTGYGALSGWLSLRVPVAVRVPPQLSTAVAVPSVTADAEHAPEVLSVTALTLAGHVTVGAW